MVFKLLSLTKQSESPLKSVQESAGINEQIQASSKQVSTISDQVLTDSLSSGEDLTAAFTSK